MATTTVGTIQLIATIDTSKYKKGADEIDDANKGMEDSAEGVERSNKKTTSSFISLARKGIGVAVTGALALSTAIAAMTLKGGFDRALNIEDAQAKLRGLGHDANSVSTIMTNALNSVRGTAFGLDAAATTAANAVASGIKPGAQLEQVLKTVANTASLAGRDMSELGAIFNKVAASNKVQMDVINQLHDAGVPALALIAKEIGKTAEETADMASEGKINFETFERAMREGVGNAALEMGNATRGSIANMTAAFSRAGAIVADKVLPHLRGSIQGITKQVDLVAKQMPGAIDTIVSEFGKLSSAAGGITSSLATSLAKGDYKSVGVAIGTGIASGINSAIQAIGVGKETITKFFQSIDWLKLGIDVGTGAVAFFIGLAIGLANTDFGKILEGLANNWQAVLIGVLSVAFAPNRFIDPITKILSKIPILGTFMNFLIKKLRGGVEQIRMAFGSLFSGAGGFIRTQIDKIGVVFNTVKDIWFAPFRILVDNIALAIRLLPTTISNTFNAILSIFNTIGRSFVNVFSDTFFTITNIIRGFLQPIASFFQGIFTGFRNVAGSTVSTIGDWFGALFIRITSIFQAIPTFFFNIFMHSYKRVTDIFSGITGFFSRIWSAVSYETGRVFGGIVSSLREIWGQILNIFNRAGIAVGESIGGSVRWAISSVLRGAVNIINGFIDSINSVIGAVNKVSPVKIGNVGRLAVPQLAEGGIVSSATLAVIGEGREPEAVIPLSKLDQMMNNQPAPTDTTPIRIDLRTSSQLQREMAVEIINNYNEVLRSRGLPQLGVA